MLVRAPPSAWQNGVVLEGEYMYYEQYLSRCQRMCVTVVGKSGQADLYVSPPPEENPTVKSAAWYSRLVQTNVICVDPETPGFEPGIFRIAVHCSKGYHCPARFFIKFEVTSVENNLVRVRNQQFDADSNNIDWYKLCNVQTPVVRTVYPESGANSAARGDGTCKFPFTYRGRVYTKCIVDGMPYKWCYHANGTWGQCDLGYVQHIQDLRPSYVATLQNGGNGTGLGPLRIVSLKDARSRPATRNDGFDISAIRPSHYGYKQTLVVPTEDSSNSGMVYIGVYAACPGCSGNYNLTVQKQVDSKASNITGHQVDSGRRDSLRRDANNSIGETPTLATRLTSTMLSPGQSHSWTPTMEVNATVPTPMFFTIPFTPYCLDLVIEITAEPSQELSVPSEMPRLFLSKDHNHPTPTQSSFSSDMPLGSSYIPDYIPYGMRQQKVPGYNRIWVSHQSPDFSPGYWYVGVHCVSDDPSVASQCNAEMYTITYLHPTHGNYPREAILGDPVSLIGRTKRAEDPTPFSFCVEVDELGVQISTDWLPSLNVTIEEQNAKAAVRGDYVSPPDPTTTPFFAMSRFRDVFDKMSATSTGPMFLSDQFQKGTLGAVKTNDTLTMCSQVGWFKGVWYIGVFPYCLTYERYTPFEGYPGFENIVACLPWYENGEKDPGLRFALNTKILKPQCENDCTSSVTYTRTIGPEKHGKCFGCRGTCLCDKYWSGESCAAAECSYDNCMGHGVCSSDGVNAIGAGVVLAGRDKFDCVCDPGYKGASCVDKLEDKCAFKCYGQGNCDYRWINEPTNITIGSCNCVMNYAGHLCAFVDDKKLESSFVPTPILICTVLVGACVMVSIRITRYNRVQDAKDEYDAMRHATQTFDAPKEGDKNELFKADEEDDEMSFEDDDDAESDESEDWPDDRDWRPKDRKVIQNDGKVGNGDVGVRREKTIE